PVGIVLELSGPAVNRPPAFSILQENVREPASNLLGHLVQVHVPAGASGTFNGEVVAIISVELQKGTDDEAIDRHPDGTAPVRVAAEHAGVGFRRQIGDTILLAAGVEDVRVSGVITRQRTDAERAEEFIL